MVCRLVAAVMLLGSALGLPTTARAQDTGSVSDSYLRVDWELQGTARGGFRPMCGRVYNNRHVTALRVGLVAEGLDTAGQVISSRYKEILGDVPAGGYSYFCVPLEAGATTYRLSIRSVDWGFATGQ